MFDAQIKTIKPGKVTWYGLRSGMATITYGEVLELWKSNADFRTFFSELLANAPFAAFRWETPALTTATAQKPFEFVLLNAPAFCSRPVDTFAFSEHFNDEQADEGIVRFDNLGRDATMIVPAPRASDDVYGHLADFIRSAPARQVDALWRVVGGYGASRVSEVPCWISTAGGGVAWLHVRIDSRPKYYGYKPYRQTKP